MTEQLVLPPYAFLPLVSKASDATSTGAGNTTLTIQATAGEMWIIAGWSWYHDDVAARVVHEYFQQGDLCKVGGNTALAGSTYRYPFADHGLQLPLVLVGLQRSLLITVDALANTKKIYSKLIYYRIKGMGSWSET